VATALWSSGELAIRERRNFQRIYDLAERVIPECWRQAGLSESQAIEQLLLQALKLKLPHGKGLVGRRLC